MPGPPGADPRARLGALLVFLIAVATTNPESQWAFACYGTLLLAAAAAARVSLAGLAARAALVLPFTAALALLLWWTASPLRALALLEKSFLSASAAMLLSATTPLPAWTAALDAWRFPLALSLTIQFVYRYLFTLADQARRMRMAAQSRGGARFGSAAGQIGVLFAHSWRRADAVHGAMLARGFTGRFPPAAPLRWRAADTLLFGAGAAACIAIRLGL
jgi:cobalt/nickel transport system permease protein